MSTFKSSSTVNQSSHTEVNTRRTSLKLLINLHKLFFMTLTTITIYNDCNRKIQSWRILKQIH